MGEAQREISPASAEFLAEGGYAKNGKFAKMVPMRGTKSLLCALAIVTNSISFVSAQAVITFDRRFLGGSFDGPDQMQGWEFVPNVDMTVVQLGLFDGQQTGGFQQNHAVALWDLYPQMIAFASIPQGSSIPLVGNFRFVDIEPTLLRAGQTYVIGAYMPAPVSDLSALFTPEAAAFEGIHVSPLINLTACRAGLSPGGPSFPEHREEAFIGSFGPNFIISNPPPAPIIRSFAFGSTIVLRASPATNIFSIVAEYKTNLNDSNWTALTTLSNSFLNGSNELVCRRPLAGNLFIRLRVN